LTCFTQPSKIRTTPYNAPGEDPLGADLFVYCPQEAILDLSNPELGVEERTSKSQDVMQIFAAIHEKKRQNSRDFRQYSSREELKKAYADGPIAAMGREDW